MDRPSTPSLSMQRTPQRRSQTLRHTQEAGPARPGPGGVPPARASAGPGGPDGLHSLRRTQGERRAPAQQPPAVPIRPEPLGVAPRGGDLRAAPTGFREVTSGARSELRGEPEVARTDNASASSTRFGAAVAGRCTSPLPGCWTTTSCGPPRPIHGPPTRTGRRPPTTGSMTPGTRPSRCGAAGASNQRNPTSASPVKWWPSATGWCRPSSGRNTLNCASCLQPPCRSTPTAGRGAQRHPGSRPDLHRALPLHRRRWRSACTPNGWQRTRRRPVGTHGTGGGERDGLVDYRRVIGSPRSWPGAGSGAQARGLRPPLLR